MNDKKRLVAFSAGLAVMILSSASAVSAQSNIVGEDAYTMACAVCHGADGKGGGEFAAMLTTQPSDLTVLKQNDSDKIFPYLKVFQIVDGRTQVPAHGSREMPIWGAYFRNEPSVVAAEPYGTELLVRAKITALVDYIESLQVE